jgi:rhamnose transport system ATP-binding protein
VALLEFRHLHKHYGAVVALRDVSFSIADGEAHAIVGENGAGKSTLLKILAGSVRPDGGALCVGGSPVALGSPRDALARGIGVVHQEMLAFPNLSVAANIFAGRELTGRLGWLKSDAMRARAADLLARLHVPVSPDALVDELPLAYRQLLQVARALAFECRVLALDEPTTALTAAETAHLFRVLDGLKRDGVTLIYVSHRLPEVFRICDRITALRDGRYIATFDAAQASGDDVVQAMVGRPIPVRAHEAAVVPAGAPLLQIDALSRPPCFEDVSLAVRAGEVVALFGLVGSGRTELLETIVGLRRPGGGAVRVDGAARAFRSPRDAARAGVALVPEDRQRQGLFFNLSLRHNLMLPRAEASGRVLQHRSERREAEDLLERWRIKAPSIDVGPDSLSGGNQQKVVLAKWLGTAPRVLLLDEPTKGVDVGAKDEIHAVVRALAARGTACLVVSSDLPEVLSLADRIVVMRAGRLCGELPAADADEERVMRLATASTAPGTPGTAA